MESDVLSRIMGEPPRALMKGACTFVQRAYICKTARVQSERRMDGFVGAECCVLPWENGWIGLREVGVAVRVDFCVYGCSACARACEGD